MATWNESKQRWQASAGTGKDRRWFRGKTPDEAEAKKAEFLNGPAPLKPGSLEEFIETIWWPRTKAGCEDSTLAGYKQIVAAELPNFYHSQSGLLLVDIRLEQLQPWIERMRAERKLSPKRIRNVWTVLHGMLKLAHMMGRYPHQDFNLVVTPKITRRKDRRDLTVDRMMRIYAASAGMSIEGPIYSAVFLGLRRNEACGLKKSHVEFDGKTAIITIQDNRQKFGDKPKLKNRGEGEVRRLAVPAEVGRKLLSYGDHDGIYIFHDHHDKPINPDRITKDMPLVCAKAGVAATEFRELRAAAASNLRELGVDPFTIQDFLGHKSIDTTTLYQDRRDSGILKATRRLSSAYDARKGKA